MARCAAPILFVWEAHAPAVTSAKMGATAAVRMAAGVNARLATAARALRARTRETVCMVANVGRECHKPNGLNVQQTQEPTEKGRDAYFTRLKHKGTAYRHACGVWR